MKRAQSGFTLVELLVVMSVIAILVSVVYLNFSDSSAASRDQERQAALREVQNALELYRKENGRYPEACRGALQWSGEQGTVYACSGGDQYIIGLVPKYIKKLPTDPKPGTGDYGYAYLVNSAGTVYKFISRNSIESTNNYYTSYNQTSAFKACDVVLDPAEGDLYVDCSTANLPPEYSSRCGLGVCNMYYSGGSWQRPAVKCALTNVRRTLSVWGGYANPEDVGQIGAPGNYLNSYANKVERGTEAVVCELP